MNEFGHIADDLTSLEMRLERMFDSTQAKPLKAALQRAFIEACKASRAQRLEDESPAQVPQAPHAKAPSRKKGSVSGALDQKKSAVTQMRSAQFSA